MAAQGARSFGRSFWRRQRPARSDLDRVAEKREAAAAATAKWLSVLREMEQDGQTTDPRYEAYYQAYVRARQQERQAEIEWFNLRHGLLD